MNDCSPTGASATPRNASPLPQWASVHRVAVAYSGGRDSTALLHATVCAAGAEGVQVLALHVHHGLSEHADAWLSHCDAQCERWRRQGLALEFRARRLSGQPGPGESIEAWARRERYRALAEMAREAGAGLVLLAHHQRDQAESFVLQALRSAGTKGLSAMPASAEREGIRWERPWLDKPWGEIEQYVRRHRLEHVEDDSNADDRFARNRLRLRVWPALSRAFPEVDAAFAQSAVWAQQASALAEEVGEEDVQRLADADGLRVGEWLALSEARRANALRLWLRRCVGTIPAASTASRLMQELPVCKQARWPLGSGDLRLYRGRLRWQPERVVAPVPERETSLSILAPGSYALPGWGGDMEVAHVPSDGVPLAWLAHLELRTRGGGERFQAGPGRPLRSLKKQFQDAQRPAWEREGPLVYSGGQLVYVPGLGLDARVLGLAGQALVSLQWRPADGR